MVEEKKKHIFLLRFEESAILTNNFSSLAFTIDSFFTVKSIFFKGGNISKLAITNTINDLVIAKTKLIYLTVSSIIKGVNYKE